MANPTIAVTTEPSNNPPRVKVVVTDSGSPAVTSVTVTRTDPDGSTVPVRTQDGNPLALNTSGSNRVGTLYDYEPPYGQIVRYGVQQNPSSTAQVQLDSSVVWLIHPGVPSRSLVIDCRPASFESATRAVRRGVFQPLGRRSAVVVTDGRRKAPESRFLFRTERVSDVALVEALADDAQTLLLNVPINYGWGITRNYIAVGDIDEVRPSDIGFHAYRDWTFPYVVVDRPAGGSQAQWNLAGVLAGYATLADVKAAFPNLAALQANTPTGG